jgi:UDP-perosamine 4-acetyltransferase
VESVLVVGAGGHAKVILEILEEANEFHIAGCTSAVAGQQDLLGFPILGGDEVLPACYAAGVRKAFIALGDNRARRKKAKEVAELGFELVNAISKRAIVSPRARLGSGVAIMPGAVINALAEVKDGAIVNTGATVDHDCRLANFCHVGPGSNLAGGVTIGEGAFLGTGVRAIPGISVGAWSVIGAGAVVIENIREGVTAVGVPAVIIKDLKSEPT